MNKDRKKVDKALDKIPISYEKELIRNYQLTLKELRGQIALIHEKYDGDWIEMNKYNRLTKLEKQVAQEIGKLTGKNAQTLKRGMMEAYEESYYSTAYVMTNEVKTDLGFSKLDRKLVEKSIHNPLDRVGFLKRNRMNQERLTIQLREQITQSLNLGEGYAKAAARIKDRMDVGASKVIRIAQTEMHRVRNAASLDSMMEGRELGINIEKTWLASGDASTRDSHQELDGVTIPLDEEFHGEDGSGLSPSNLGSASEDINCRCTMIETISGLQPKARAIRGAGVTEYATYKEFKEEGLL